MTDLLKQSIIKQSSKDKSSSLEKDLSAFGKIGSDLLKGTATEVEKHPLKIAEDFGIGVATSVAVSAFPILAAPVLAAGLVELAINHKKLIKMTNFLAQDYSVIRHKHKYSHNEVKLANKDFQNVGKTLAGFAASFAGGMTGS